MYVKKLKNNMKYIINNNKSKFSVNILLLFNVGSRHEVKHKYGLAHYFEHLLFNGTKKYPTSKSISDRIYKYGGETNAFTSYDITGYYITINYKYTEIALDILSDMLFNSIFTDYIKEKDVVINENIKFRTNPRTYCRSQFENMIYKNTPFEHDVIGLNKDIKKFTKKDILDFIKNIIILIIVFYLYVVKLIKILKNILKNILIKKKIIIKFIILYIIILWIYNKKLDLNLIKKMLNKHKYIWDFQLIVLIIILINMF